MNPYSILYDVRLAWNVELVWNLSLLKVSNLYTISVGCYEYPNVQNHTVCVNYARFTKSSHIRVLTIILLYNSLGILCKHCRNLNQKSFTAQ